MAITEYEKALKLAEKCYRSKVIRGEYPYLQVLDEILNYVDIEAEVSLGLVEIPLEKIAGTKTAGRTKAFAANFMPLLDDKSEFAAKWNTLYLSMQEEGLNTPIKAYEYMNRFYVMEGNKRVSVMKLLNAVSIPGTVIRMLPKRNDTKENRLYYEFLDFYRVTGINYLDFSELGEYEQLLKLVDCPEDRWDEDLRRDFHHIYIFFSTAFRARGGDKLDITVGDALLGMLKIYGYQRMLKMSSDEMRDAINKTWKEYTVLQEEEAIKLQMQPSEDKPSIFKMILPDTKLRIAFVHDKTAKTSSWTYGHELGRSHLEHVFGDRVETTCFDDVSLDHGVDVLTEIIADGYDMIFTTTPRLMNASLLVAAKYPDFKIMNCSLYTSHPLLRTYYCRMYEAKYLMGMIAGAMAESDQIGYIADYPINGMIAAINAFALGAQLVNPRAKVHLRWSTIVDAKPEDELRALGVSYISGRDWIMPDDVNRHFGLYRADQESGNLAMPVWDWGNFYERIVRRVFNGNWNNEAAVKERRALNYYWGMSAGVIDVLHSKSLPTGLVKLIDLMKQQIVSGALEPFSGPITAQDGTLVVQPNHSLTPDEIIRMDWLVENVDGIIPTSQQLSKDAQAVVEVQGILSN